MKRISRRYAIKCGLASLVGATSVFTGWRWFPLGFGSGTAYAQTQQRVCVSVHGPDGRHLLNRVTVKLSPVGGGAPSTLAAEGTLPPVLYGGDVAEGVYDLTVDDAGSLRAPPCKVAIVGEQAGCIGVYMFPKGSPCLSYRIGGSRIPFHYDPSILGVLVPGQAANSVIAEEYARKLANHGLSPFNPAPADSQSWITTRGHIWLFSLHLDAPAHDAQVSRARQAAANAIRTEFKKDPRFHGIPADIIRVGAPTQLEPGNVKILDTRYVVRLKKPYGSGAQALINGRLQNVQVLRRLNLADDAYLIEFPDYDHPEHLRQVERWLRSGEYLYIEPDLIVELQQHVCTEPPDDGAAPCQEGLKRQRVPEAWCLLEERRGPENKLGRSSLCVGLIEFPADPTHPDLDTAQIRHCQGFSWVPSIPCYRVTDGRLELNPEFLESDGNRPKHGPLHGTWVYGVGGATTGNLESVAGIAPTVAKVIAVPPSGVAITTYCEMVLWLAGLGVPFGSSAPQLGAAGNPPAADVINCSHGVGSMPTPAQVCDTFARVTYEGRQGRGTVLVYSAGNENHLIENYQAFANNPHVITVGATMVVGTINGPVEQRWIAADSGRGSNWGHSLDLCTIGAKVPTLDPRLGETYVCGNYSAKRVSAPSGTSLAAPAVSAACALMLTANSDLSWCQVRDLLRDSARRPLLNALDFNLQELAGTWADERNLYFGSGSLDVFEAVQSAMNTPAQPGGNNCAVSCNYTTTCADADPSCDWNNT